MTPDDLWWSHALALALLKWHPFDGDDLDGCSTALAGPAHQLTLDADIDALVLFADVQFDKPAEVDARVAAYQGLFS